MMNSSLVCFFIIYAIFLIDPSDGTFVNVSPTTNKNRYASRDSMDRYVELIGVDERQHPDRICQYRLDDKEARWLPLYMSYLPYDICSEHLVCGVEKSGKIPIVLNERPAEGSQCSTTTTDDDYLEGCLEGLCMPFTKVDNSTSDS